jgi:predicted AAA+ superfamily ATPase
VYRKISIHLNQWKEDPNRKSLLLRGARQVGKTYSIRELGQSFEHFLEVNFEEDKPVCTFFSQSLNPKDLCEKLSAYFDIPIIPGKTLLFLDEIQACPNALRSLRFFHEKKPNLHVAAAGSLIEFALNEIPSFGVGRITTLHMYPMTFEEFLIASGSEKLVELTGKADFENPIDQVLHDKLIEKVRIYQMIGGMPAVVSAYTSGSDIKSCQLILDELLSSIRMDFAKYRKRVPAIRLQEVLNSTAYQAGNKFKYSSVGLEIDARACKACLELLVQAGLVYKVYHTSAQGLPLGAQINSRKFKTLLFDIGIHQRLMGLNLAEHLVKDKIELINKGNMAEVLTGLELKAGSSPFVSDPLYYWHREKRSSSAEVDYVIDTGGKISPVEVKAGTKGAMKSLYIFLDERNLDTGIRVSSENFSTYDRIESLPIYTVSRLVKPL